jgi:peptidoglycan/xylan/chitin deacetylase (PgdA/CDA1 family)
MGGRKKIMNVNEAPGTVSGIVLGFDDYYPDIWEQYFDLFDKYNAKVTFFVTGNSVTKFMTDAQERGHEIAYHTINHFYLSKIPEKQFFEQTVSRIDAFKDAGVELSTFGYPYGDYKDWMNNELLKSYKIVRGYGGNRNYTAEEMKYGFVESTSIDNIRCESDEAFKLLVDTRLSLEKNNKSIALLNSHEINSADWGITPERLIYLLNKGQEMELKFYTYKELQNL